MLGPWGSASPDALFILFLGAEQHLKTSRQRQSWEKPSLLAPWAEATPLSAGGLDTPRVGPSPHTIDPGSGPWLPEC